MRTPFFRLARSGFTLTEMMTVVVVIGLLILFTFPRAGLVFDRTQVHSARGVVVNMFQAARVAARQSNRTTAIHLAGQRVWVERRVSSTVVDTTVELVDLSAVYGVAMSSSVDSIVIDPRGFSSGAATIVLARSGFADTVLIGRYGKVSR